MGAGGLYRWLQATAAMRPDAAAMTFLRPGNHGAQTYTYRSLFDYVERLGRELASHGLDRTAPIGLLLKSQEDQVLHYLAALHAGLVPAVLTPPNRKLNPEYYRQTMAAVLSRCQFAALVSDVDAVEVHGPTFTPHSLQEHRRKEALNVEAIVDPGAALPGSFLQFSSGTTGIKRGVVVSDQAVMDQLVQYAKVIRLSHDDCILSWLPLYHDMGFIACLNMPLAHGVHTVMMEPTDWVSAPARYLTAASEHRATLSWNPNFAYAFMAQRVPDDQISGVDLSSLRALVNCSEPVTNRSQRMFSDRFALYGLAPDVFKGCYAMAETTFALTHGEPTAPDSIDQVGPAGGARAGDWAEYVSVGQPLPGVELVIVDPCSGAPLPDRVIGEIWVRSPFNFCGYHNDPEATAQAFVDDWYRTRDLGYRVGESIFVTGRRGDVLIVGGINVFPQDIEDLVSDVAGVHPGRVAVFAMFDDNVQTERIVVLAESHLHDTDSAGLLTVEIRQRILAGFQIANFDVALVPLGWLVKSTSGKMSRSASRAKWLRRRTVAAADATSPSHDRGTRPGATASQPERSSPTLTRNTT